MQRHSSKLSGRPAAILGLGLALLVAGCGGPDRHGPEEGAAGPRTAAQATVTDLVYAADLEHGRLQVVGPGGRVLRTLPAGVPSPDWRTLYVAEGGAERTTVRAVDVATGRQLRSTTVAGRFRLPVVGAAGVPDGLSGDGGTLALGNLADAPVSRFAILPTDFSRPPELVDLPGDFWYDRRAGRLDPTAIVDKRDAWETSMAGYPNTRVTAPGGEWVYTLYRNAVHGPFVHALNAEEGFAFCIDLPRGRGGDDRTARLWTLVRDATGGRLYAVNTALGLVSEIDGQQFSVLRTASFAPDLPRVDGPPARPGSVVLSDVGDVLLVGGPNGVVAIGTGSLRVQRRDLAGWAVDGLVASADGRRVYALSSARGRVVAIDPASGRLLAELPAPAATLLLRAAA